MPASLAASENVDQESVASLLGTAPGSTLELPAGSVTEAPNRSLCVKRLRISAPAALKLLCPDEYSGNGGVGNVIGWYGSHSSPRMSRDPIPGPPQARIWWPWKT